LADAIPTAMVGGSFDPVHLGHLHLVHTVARNTGYRRFIFVPVAQNNFKRDANPASAEHRLQMVKLSFNAYKSLYPEDPEIQLIADDCEIRRGGVSYTYDTVKELYLKYTIKGRLALVMGDDLLGDLKKWYEYEALKQLVSFVVIRRETSLARFEDSAADMLYLDNVVYEDSATQIRNACLALKEGEDLPQEIAALMSEEVSDYVRNHRLYRS